EPENPPGGANLVVPPNTFVFDSVDVPVDATNLSIIINYDLNLNPTPLPLELFVRRGELPTRTEFDYMMTITPPGTNILTITTNSLPPLNPGRYFIGIYNPNGIAQFITLNILIGLNLNAITPVTFNSVGNEPILDDAVTNFVIPVASTQKIASVE